MIKFAQPTYFGNEVEYAKRAVESGWISGGEYVEQLEENFARFFATSVTLTSNGTSALQLAYTTLGLIPGDEVIIPGYGFLAAANVALQLGLKPVFVDVDENSFLISAEKIREKITPNTKAIVVIHNYGFMCDMKEIVALGIPVIEDCAESIFSKQNDQYCGTFGTIGVFSFHATKTFTTGEGGMLITNDWYLHEITKLYQSHGLKTRGTYNHTFPGNNFRMSNIHAAIGVAQFENIEKILAKKELVTLWYDKLMDIPDENVLWSLPILVDNKYKMQIALNIAGIEHRPGFIPPSSIWYFNTDDLPNSEDIYRKTLVLPLHLSLTENDVKYICNTIIKELNNGY